jgi:single-strand DNA-binding protein
VVDNYVTKGTNLYVEGSIDYRKYTDKSGVEKYTTDIKGYILQMINSPDAYKEVESSAPEGKREVSGSAKAEMASIAKEVSADDIPF